VTHPSYWKAPATFAYAFDAGGTPTARLRAYGLPWRAYYRSMGRPYPCGDILRTEPFTARHTRTTVRFTFYTPHTTPHARCTRCPAPHHTCVYPPTPAPRTTTPPAHLPRAFTGTRQRLPPPLAFARLPRRVGTDRKDNLDLPKLDRWFCVCQASPVWCCASFLFQHPTHHAPAPSSNTVSPAHTAVWKKSV